MIERLRINSGAIVEKIADNYPLYFSEKYGVNLEAEKKFAIVTINNKNIKKAWPHIYIVIKYSRTWKCYIANEGSEKNVKNSST